MIAQSCLALAFTVLAAAAPAPAEKAPKPIDEPCVLLTFDDKHVDNWVKAIPIFKKYNAHATFFVSHFDTLKPEQIAGLHKLQDAGHAIGCHSLRHFKAAEYVAQHGMEDYLAKEITPALALMKKEGFVPTAFAYPCSDNDAETDAALLKIFRHLRDGAYPVDGEGYAEMNGLFTPLDKVASRGVLAGRSLDGIGEPGKEGVLEQLYEAMERAVKKGECLTLYSHNIGENGRLRLKPAMLDKVLSHGQSLGLRFCSFDELP